jgi:hypothetical protein
MAHVLTLLCCTILLLGADEPREFSPKDSGLKVMMPGEPKLGEAEQNGVKVKTWYLERKGGKEAFAVSVTELSKVPGDEDARQQRLDEAREGLLRAVKGKLEKETKLKYGDEFPGREVVVSVKGDVLIRDRAFLVKGRMYQVVVTGSKDFIESDEVQKYFQSFELVK